jgi:hypothetical protein
LQETQHELSLAKEKCESAWNEASKSIFLLDEQSKKIEELSDHMKELKEYYAMQPNVSAVPSTATSSDGMRDIESVEASSLSIVITKIPCIIDLFCDNSFQSENTTSAVPAPNQTNDFVAEPSMMQTDAIEDLITSDKAEETSPSTQPWESDLSNKITLALAGTLHPATSMGQRFNSRQATASRVLFEDPLADEKEMPTAQFADHSPSNLHSVLDPARAPETLAGESAI